MLILSKKGDYNYLISTFFGNREKIYIGKTTKISVSDINKLVNKQINSIKKEKTYLSFLNEMHNSELLDQVINKNLFIKTIMLTKKLSGKISLEKDLETMSSKYNTYYNNDFIVDFVYNSNKIEGSKIPVSQLKKIIQKRLFNYTNKNEIQEVLNSKLTIEYMNEGFLFNQQSIKRAYHILTKSLFQETGDKYPRGYKKVPNVVGNTATSDPDNVSRDIDTLLLKHKKNKNNKFLIQNSFDFHFSFERIHPFQNGNGRIGRFLMNKILQAGGFLPMIIREQNRERYFNSFISSIDGNKKKYYKFLLEQYLVSLEKACK